MVETSSLMVELPLGRGNTSKGLSALFHLLMRTSALSIAFCVNWAALDVLIIWYISPPPHWFWEEGAKGADGPVLPTGKVYNH